MNNYSMMSKNDREIIDRMNNIGNYIEQKKYNCAQEEIDSLRKMINSRKNLRLEQQINHYEHLIKQQSQIRTNQQNL